MNIDRHDAGSPASYLLMMERISIQSVSVPLICLHIVFVFILMPSILEHLDLITINRLLVAIYFKFTMQYFFKLYLYSVHVYSFTF